MCDGESALRMNGRRYSVQGRGRVMGCDQSTSQEGRSADRCSNKEARHLLRLGEASNLVAQVATHNSKLNARTSQCRAEGLPLSFWWLDK